MRTTKLNVLRMVAATLFLSAAVSCTRNDGTSAGSNKILRIGSSAGEGKPFYGLTNVALENKFIDEELEKIGWKVEYNTFQNGVAVNEALLSGDIDISIIGDVPAVTGFRNNIGDVWIASNVPSQPLAIVSSKKSGITRPEEIVGKTVSLNLGTNAQQLFENFIEEYHISKDSVNIVNMTIHNGSIAVITGDVDVVFGNATNLLPIVERGEANLIYNTAEKADWSAQSLVVANKKFLEKNHEAGVAYLKALIRADKEFKNHPDENYDIYSGRLITEYPVLGAKLYNPQEFSPEIKTPLINKIQDLYNLLKSVGRVEGDFDVRGSVDNSFYVQAAKEIHL